jgi:O-antigen ligase
MHMDPAEWHRLDVGRANVHNDPMQFLAEFGAIGAALMAAVVGVLLAPWRRLVAVRNPVMIMSLLGIIVTSVHSLVDLPFRCPTVMYHWLVVLAVMPAVVPVSGKERCRA